MSMILKTKYEKNLSRVAKIAEKALFYALETYPKDSDSYSAVSSLFKNKKPSIHLNWFRSLDSIGLPCLIVNSSTIRFNARTSETQEAQAQYDIIACFDGDDTYSVSNSLLIISRILREFITRTPFSYFEAQTVLFQEITLLSDKYHLAAGNTSAAVFSVQITTRETLSPLSGHLIINENYTTLNASGGEFNILKEFSI